MREIFGMLLIAVLAIGACILIAWLAGGHRAGAFGDVATAVLDSFGAIAKHLLDVVRDLFGGK